ncbi:helix-turn-helix domain-containing protein [Oceanobacillus salinisoli]|uniref:helix-turn-helix domain-containing protein n=1 Tax=Oceanobacillus salinisoli TaxID=2678611 RepID=UPI0012E2305F|nr:helix-turn-helix transcriptional regulator [Oceanobacillus salinisoli]
MLDQQIIKEIERYIELHQIEIYSLYESVDAEYVTKEMELEDFIENNREPEFQQVLFEFIDRSGLRDPEVYKRAGIDRRHFSKIRSSRNYLPKKNTLIALAFALELDREETDELLHAAGYSLTNSDTSDLVIQYCLEKRITNIHDVNEALDYFSLEPLMG